ncbi:unnamed protein product [Chrysodeixis includens]|uniref:Uncharacterized protein n=1 Tax=Chrysodeixis includens TaxID=689277 RepID=A0A9N8KV45_CHRIL|nr:unnamed protein product [Chrysodeixis includens]
MANKMYLSVILVLVIVQNSNEFRFMRRIQAIGTPYYKIMMSLGVCKAFYKVSRVEIKLVINNTSSFAYSEAGVGFPEFSATLFLPTHLNYVIYTVTIFTCNKEKPAIETRETTTDINPVNLYMPFILRDNNT